MMTCRINSSSESCMYGSATFWLSYCIVIGNPPLA
jgi:hypothetical protein